MPHLIIEFSEQVESMVSPQLMVEQIRTAAMASGLFNEQAIKVRAMGYQHFRNGVDDNDFIHVTARILSGRTLEQRQSLSEILLKTLQNMSLPELSLSVEVVEMERESYLKSTS